MMQEKYVDKSSEKARWGGNDINTQGARVSVFPHWPDDVPYFKEKIRTKVPRTSPRNYDNVYNFPPELHISGFSDLMHLLAEQNYLSNTVRNPINYKNKTVIIENYRPAGPLSSMVFFTIS